MRVKVLIYLHDNSHGNLICATSITYTPEKPPTLRRLHSYKNAIKNYI